MRESQNHALALWVQTGVVVYSSVVVVKCDSLCVVVDWKWVGEEGDKRWCV